MAQTYSANTSASFIFASLQEFVNLWRSESEASFKLDCKDGKASISFSCHLGNPDDHIQHGRRRKKKSVTRVQRNNARAAAFQAARAGSQSQPPPPPPPHRTVTSPPPSHPPPARSVISLAVPVPVPVPVPFPFPPLPPSPDNLVPADTESSPLSSLREEPENASQVITDLELWRQVQLCSAGPPHSCEEFYRTANEDELEVLEKWNSLSKEQAGGTRRRPDLKRFLCGEPSEGEGFYPPSFWCSALRSIRPEILRSESRDSHDVSCLPFSPLPSFREEPERQEDEIQEINFEPESQSENSEVFSEVSWSQEEVISGRFNCVQYEKPCSDYTSRYSCKACWPHCCIKIVSNFLVDDDTDVALPVCPVIRFNYSTMLKN